MKISTMMMCAVLLLMVLSLVFNLVLGWHSAAFACIFLQVALIGVQVFYGLRGN